MYGGWWSGGERGAGCVIEIFWINWMVYTTSR
jgi:hypothetical protein